MIARVPSRLKVAVLSGGPSREHEVSLCTGRVVLAHLDAERFDPLPVHISRRGRWDIPAAVEARSPDAATAIDRLKTLGVEVVFNALHGEFGEDGTLQGLLDDAGLPYTGSDASASRLAMDKDRSSALFSGYGMLVPLRYCLTQNQWASGPSEIVRRVQCHVPGPWMVKPTDRGSSVGVTLVMYRDGLHDAISHALAHSGHCMVQQHVSGIEVTCGVLQRGERRPLQALPPTEIIPRRAAFFDYEAKYTPMATAELTPARLSERLIDAVQMIGLEAHRLLGCAGLSRTDMIVQGERVYVLETNTLPGLTGTSLLPQAAAAAGIGLPTLLHCLIDDALRRK